MASLYQRFTGKINTANSFPHPPEASRLLGGQVADEENAVKSPQQQVVDGRAHVPYRKKCVREDEATSLQQKAHKANVLSPSAQDSTASSAGPLAQRCHGCKGGEASWSLLTDVFTIDKCFFSNLFLCSRRASQQVIHPPGISLLCSTPSIIQPLTTSPPPTDLSTARLQAALPPPPRCETVPLPLGDLLYYYTS
ncbi:unnamed protein product [Pleuronectes platessa]|uniref:Uncharacterized protein n=1 Tax=Pleuronectes platessa TaxID=8262 RepID=A0A9N7ULA5_PLEPL|nr:unnamed protein product [Pleuronectes platessa]